ncbi:MAG: right-handed parallel beta-helix repeat-containing protein, partial [SAR324 cluster bacterium]|nr:right-handed parallel beta-helix repeat-containing protein [SAR324 cluster bacterium]
PVEPEHLYIRIKDKHYRKLERQRNIALENGLLDSTKIQYLPAKISFQKKEYKIKLRLKGLQRDHWETDQWSLRIQMKGEKHLFGMKRFSLQHPRTRSYLYEWLFHKVLQREGILYRRYKFIRVTINEQYMGLYALEEDFDKRLIENSQMREAPVIKDWQGNAYQSKKIAKDKDLSAQLSIAKNLIKSFYQNQLKTNQVFDSRKLARFLAISDVFSAHHAVELVNIRFYYNPITSKLEPIGSDASMLLERNGISLLAAEIDKHHKYFYDKTFVLEYIRQLKRLSSVSYLDNLFLEIAEELDHNLKLIYSSYPYFQFTEGFLYKNQNTVKQAIPRILANSIEAKLPINYSVGSKFFENDILRQPPNPEHFEFLKIDHQDRLIAMKPGTWSLRNSLVLPNGYKFMIEKGTHLKVFNSSKIISYSSIQLLGESEKPILIDSPDSTGQGIVVIQAESKSLVRHVIFRNLKNPVHQGWKLTGAINFYESPVDFESIKFLNTRSEDALNIVRSNFSIDHAIFKSILSDAIDIDYGEGVITHLSIFDCGNDGVDFSGSKIQIEKIQIQNCGDKAVSVGEKSQVSMKDIQIRDVQVALTSKDQSEVEVENVSIEDSKFGIAVFEKKNEFGPAQIKIRRLNMKNIQIPFLVEHHSNLVVDENQIEANKKKVKKLLYKKAK